MNADQAARVLTEPKYLRTMIDALVREMEHGVLEPPPGEPPLTMDRISELRATVKGMRLVQGFITEAEATLRRAEEEAAEHKEEESQPVPPGLASAMLAPTGKVSDGG